MASQTHIQVTQSDIDGALKKDSSRCVVATAIARAFPNASHIAVDVQSIRFTVEGERRVYLTPYAVAGYVVAFDAGDEIHPFSFRLREDQRVKARQTKRTPAGAKVHKARTDAQNVKRKAERAKARAERKAAEKAAPAEVKAERAKAKALADAVPTAEAERDQVVAAFAGQKQTVETPGRRIPQVTPRKARAYGHRTLRINQEQSS